MRSNDCTGICDDNNILTRVLLHDRVWYVLILMFWVGGHWQAHG